MKFSQTPAGLGLFLSLSLSVGADNFKHITIDGSFDDWAGIAPAYVDPPFQDDPAYQQDPSRFAGAIDLKAVYVAHDNDHLYVRLTLYTPGDPFTSHENVFVDADNDRATGYSAAGLVGSEMLIQGGVGYQEKNGAFNDGSNIGGLDWAAAPSGMATDFEFRISRQAKYDSDSLPVFAGDTIAFLLETENANYATVETAPDTEGITYTFSPAPPPATGNSALVTVSGTAWRVNATGNDLGTAWREIGYDDSQAGWSAGAGLFGFTTNSAAYPAPIQTPLAGGQTTYYLRAQFQWTNDPASVVLVASNYLSDGAVFYLNGAEVKRLRLPSGDVLFNTPALGVPATEGQVEVAGFATTPLVIGANLLAVEAHQTAGDQADLVFGMSLVAATQFPVVITDPSQPADRSVGAGDATTFFVEFVGTSPLIFQWLKDNNPVLDATNSALTIDPVLQGDAGSYVLRISNPLSTNYTRAAVLAVTNSPVRITDPTQPADQTVIEGLPVAFAVDAVGSAPISFQWFRRVTAIPDATNATFAISDARISDAGDYYVIVTNPYPSSVTSRKARLTVNRDTTPPTLGSVLGTPNKVTITFSEPVTAASANAITNYSLDGGLTVTGTTQDPNDAAVVILTTSAQTLGTSYTLTINNVLDRFDNVIAQNTRIAFKSAIAIEGTFDDWTGVPLAFTDPQDSTESTDYKDVYVTNDEDYLYMRVTLHTPSDLGIFYNNIFIDADDDASTGYAFSGLGSEMLIQGGGGYQQKNRGFNEGEVNGLDWAMAPAGTDTDFEFRISRHATYASDGLPVFTTNMIVFVLEAENTGFVTKDSAPDFGGFAYTFSSPARLGPLAVRLDQGQVTISWSGSGKLQSRSSLTTGTWQEIQNAPNPFMAQPTGEQTYYRLAQ